MDAWPQPLTFTGVAAFARAPRGRLFLFQLFVSMLAAASVVTAFELAWGPVIRRAIIALPAEGAIRNTRLDWRSDVPVRVGGNSFLWISVDPTDTLEAGEGADLQVEFGATEIRLRSLFGFLMLPYPQGYRIALNRTELEPWWGAWHIWFDLALGVSVFTALLLTWAALAALYAWPVRLIGFYADRELTVMGAFRVGAASLLPGAIFFTLAILAYAIGQVNLVQLMAAAVLHLMIGWVFVLFSPFSLDRTRLPGTAPGGRKNPFTNGTESKSTNPFARRTPKS